MTTWRRPLRQRLTRSLGPLRPPLKAAHDGVFAGAVPRLAAGRLRRSGAPDGAALASAVNAIRGRGLSAQERAWVERIEARRARLAARPGAIQFERPYLPEGMRSMLLTPAHIALTASIHQPWGTFLLKLVRELRPQSCLELGAAAGLSAAYLDAGLELNGAGRLVTMEGSSDLAELARETFAELALSRVEIRVGVFDDVLEGVASEAAPIDLAYLDAGKTRADLLAQLEALVPHLAPAAVIVLDDIHWSRELAGAWRTIRRDPRFELATDLWRVGLMRRAGYSSQGSKSRFRAPQTGQNQSSGMSSKGVPGGTPPSGSPSSGS
jgi:predicted O-methyltransferase YrrM